MSEAADRAAWGIAAPGSPRGPLPKLLELKAWEEWTPPRASFRVTLLLTRWHLSERDPEARHERDGILLEAYRRTAAEAAVLPIPAGAAELPSLPARLRELSGLAAREGARFYFDFGRIEPPAWADLKDCVFDPLWFQCPPWGSYWKIHGWHPQRWIRRYPDSELRRLATLARRHRPRFVILGHPQRLEQFRELERERRKEIR